jgi:ParB-like chromosome segregation protein Spo0J
MTVYVGNTRLKSGIKLGMKKVPCIIKNWKTEKKAVAYGIANNKSDEWAAWDKDALSNLIEKKNLFNNSENNLGFSKDELKEISLFSKNASKFVESSNEWKDLPTYNILLK